MSVCYMLLGSKYAEPPTLQTLSAARVWSGVVKSSAFVEPSAIVVRCITAPICMRLHVGIFMHTYEYVTYFGAYNTEVEPTLGYLESEGMCIISDSRICF